MKNGEHLGRKIGFPTANIAPSDKDGLIPKNGAYAAMVITPDGERRPAMVNIGFRPTVSDSDSGAKLSIEAHIFDYSGYLYDEEVVVEFVSYLRGEKRFASVDKLKKQLEDDAEASRKILKR